MTRVSIDPVTRIEGHLRIDVEVDEGPSRRLGQAAPCGVASKLSCRDAIRAKAGFRAAILRVAPLSRHGFRTRVEDALQLEIPANAQYIRNLILIAHALHDHIVHFYHLSALDWIDITAIPKADRAGGCSD